MFDGKEEGERTREPTTIRQEHACDFQNSEGKENDSQVDYSIVNIVYKLHFWPLNYGLEA